MSDIRRERPLVLVITPHERTVLQLIASGHETFEIASRLGTSEQEIEASLTSLCAVMGAGSRTEAVALALRRGLVAPEDERSASVSVG
jgi:DNA-binding NarL/FixJ family response regulator